MQHINELSSIDKKFQNKPLIIGYFDCIHKGHKKLFQYVDKRNFNVLTFINVPNKSKEKLSTYNRRLKNIEKFKPSEIFVIDLQKNNTSSDNFEKKILGKIIKPSEIVVGSDFSYGKNKTGNVKSLSRVFNVAKIKYLKQYQTKKIIQMISKNKWSQINKMLYCPLMFDGIVIHGKHLGKKLGFPTANTIHSENTVELQPGIYSGYASIDNVSYPSAIFVQKKNREQLIETHILNGFSKNIYGKNIQIQIKNFIKKSKKISNTKALSLHIKSMVNLVKKDFK